MPGGDGGLTPGIADVEMIVPHQVTVSFEKRHQLLLHTIRELLQLGRQTSAEEGKQPLT